MFFEPTFLNKYMVRPSCKGDIKDLGLLAAITELAITVPVSYTHLDVYKRQLQTLHNSHKIIFEDGNASVFLRPPCLAQSQYVLGKSL